LFKPSFVDGRYKDISIDGRAGRKAKKKSVLKFFLNSFFKYKTPFLCEVFMLSSKKFLRKLVFLALLKNCKNVVALLHYGNQAAAAVDYIMFNFDNFSISNFVWTGFIKENSHVWSINVKLLFWNRPKK
jgi:hypothetical protein